MIPKDSLDDRTFSSIVEEALRLVPRYCPEWTNHNPSDPGVTLIELFAWMTEMTLYRLNRVPEKNYLALLELAGLSPLPPQSSRAVVAFFPAPGYRKPLHIPAGLQIASTASASTEEECIFETEKDLVIKENQLEACINRRGETWSDYCAEGKLRPFLLFETEEKVEHLLYLSSPLFAYLAAEHTIEISFAFAGEITSVEEELVNFLSWEYWDGRAWRGLSALRSFGVKKKKDNTLFFSGPLDIAPSFINGEEGFFLRAALDLLPPEERTLRVEEITLAAHFGGSGFPADAAFTYSGQQYTVIDMNNSFRIFSEEPAFNETFYLAADSIFSRAGSKVSIAFTFSEIYVPGEENEDARFAWEYWNGEVWTGLNRTSRFRDSTFGFRRSGEVSFVLPQKMPPVTVNGEERLWLRVRLLAKDFSLGGEYVRDEKDNWVWRFSRKVHSPVFGRLRVSFEALPQPPEKILSQTNFSWNDLTPALVRGRTSASQTAQEPGAETENSGEDPSGAKQEDRSENKREVPLFVLERHEEPRLFLGFRETFPAEGASVYIRIQGGDSSPAHNNSFGTPLFSETLPSGPRLINLAWEYWNGRLWTSLAVNDYTDYLHESGFIEFMPPPDMHTKKEFGKNLIWLRLRFVSGSFEKKPRITGILTNAVYARNAVSHTRETAGSGTGGPGQSVSPLHGPLLPGIVLCVNEGSIPPAREIENMKAEGIEEPYYAEGENIWVRYTEVPNFYSSGPQSRHFTVDYAEGKIYFGDGWRGMNPPRGKFNIQLASYVTGGGEKGNAAPGTLRILSRSIPFVAGCDNPFPAEGGADRETVDSLKARAAGVFKSLKRAVTAEDFEWLAREASPSVARAFCLAEKNRRGEIRIIVIPRPPSGSPPEEKLTPSRELLRRVRAYLDEHKLVGTKIRVEEPVYRGFSVQLTLTLKSGVLDSQRIKKKITENLRAHFHPLTGADGSGWEFGRAVSSGAVLKQLEKTSGILCVDETSLFDEDAGVIVEKIVLKDDELPFLAETRITDRRSGE